MEGDLGVQDTHYKEIQLVGGGVTKVSPEDFHRLNKHRWHMRKDDGYASRTEYEYGKFKTIRLHQEILTVPDGFVTDHINRNRLDNRRCNLRKATRSQNTANSKIPSTNSSGYKGVYYRKEQRRWRASIRVNQKLISLGQFGSPEDAAKAYNDAAVNYFGEFALLNRLPEVIGVEVSDVGESERGSGGFGSTGV